MKIQVTQYDKEYIIGTESDDLTSHEILDLFISVMRGMSYGETAINSALEKVVKDNKETEQRAEQTQTLKDVHFRDEEDFTYKPEQKHDYSHVSWANNHGEKLIKIEEEKCVHKKHEFKQNDEVIVNNKTGCFIEGQELIIAIIDYDTITELPYLVTDMIHTEWVSASQIKKVDTIQVNPLDHEQTK